MRRRDFIAGLGSAAVWPLPARAQRSDRVRQIAWLRGESENAQSRAEIATFREGMANLGWDEGSNLRIAVRYGDVDLTRIRVIAAELISLGPDVIVASTTSAIKAAQQQTRSIPIIFVGVGDPVANGVVGNIARPDGNATGFSNYYPSLGQKWVSLLKEAVPRTTRVAILFNPETYFGSQVQAMTEAASSLNVELIKLPHRGAIDIVRAIDGFASGPNSALLVVPDVANLSNISLIIRLAQQHRLPAIYTSPIYAVEGGLLAYGADSLEPFRRAPTYVDRLLRGAKVSELPVQFPTKFELVINLKTAKTLGLEIPETLLAIADEVIK
jgi:putative tryptophan/tyrosine transport system substrate-binding protein